MDNHKIQRAATQQHPCKYGEEEWEVVMQMPLLCGKNRSFTLESYMQ